MTVEAAEKELAKFLEVHPHLRPYQDRLNEELSTCLTTGERFSVLTKHILNNLDELRTEVTLLGILART